MIPREITISILQRDIVKELIDKLILDKLIEYLKIIKQSKKHEKEETWKQQKLRADKQKKLKS